MMIIFYQVQSVLMQDIIRVSKRYIIGNYFWNTFLLVEELVNINATPIIIMLVAINVCNDIGSLSMAHPKNTAITGTIYAKELATDTDSTQKPKEFGVANCST